MNFDFDRRIDRWKNLSVKWNLYDTGVLPLWVADMDFLSPEPIRDALGSAVDHGIFGYGYLTSDLQETIALRMEKLYGWHFSPKAVIAIPGVIAGFTAAARTVCPIGKAVIIQPPVYPPFLSVHKNAGVIGRQATLRSVEEGRIIQYEIDWEILQTAINSHDAPIGIFLLCNPHNPIGHEYSRSDLIRIASLCESSGAIICSDEIHAELLLGDKTHTPIASLDPKVASNTITLIAASKAFNIPGLACAFAIITNDDLRDKYKQTIDQLAMHVNIMGLIASQAAYSGGCDKWLNDLCIYLTSNRDFLIKTIQDELPGIKFTNPNATYLAWLDCREYLQDGRIIGSPQKFFLQHAKIALNDGKDFGKGGEGFVRLNFGCPQSILSEALEKMKASLISGCG